MMPKKKKPKVLIVDDEVNITLSMMEFLSKKLECYGAYSYEEAVEFLKKHRVDLVISDIKLPGKDGFDLLLWVRENQPETRVILITAYGSPAFKEKAQKSGALLYIEKPMDLNQLLRIIGKIFQTKGFDVSLSDLELVDILQFLSFYNKDVVLNVENSIGLKGEIGVKNGKVMWAKTEDLKGTDAFMEMMSWEGGAFTSSPYRDEEEGKIEDSIMHLVLEAAKHRDEVRTKEEEEFEVIIKGGEKMAELQEILEKAAGEVSELIGTAIVNLESGLPIATFSPNPDFDVAVASAVYAEVLKENNKALELLGGAEVVGETEDILVTTDRAYILVRQLGEKHYHGVAITKKGNLGLARVIMKKYEIPFLEALKELGEI